MSPLGEAFAAHSEGGEWGGGGQEEVAQVFPRHEGKAALDGSLGFSDCPSCPCGVSAIQYQRVPLLQRSGKR